MHSGLFPELQVPGARLLAGPNRRRHAERSRSRGVLLRGTAWNCTAGAVPLTAFSLPCAACSQQSGLGRLVKVSRLPDDPACAFSCPASPQFSPHPSPNRPSGPSSRLASPGGYPSVAYGDSSSVRGSPFVGAGAHLLGAGHMGQASMGLPYSPDGSLAYSLGGSGPASLDPSAAAAQLAGGAAAGHPQQASLLAQLQQIWGEGSAGGGGSGAAGGAPAFGASLGASPATTLLAGDAAAAAQQQQQQQLAALLFMQQLEMQQAALAARGLTPGCGGMPDSPPLSPQQLPAASADMLRDVLGSPLSPLRWPGGRGGTGDLLTDPSLSLGAEMAAAAATALRAIGEAGEEPAGAPHGRRSLSLSPSHAAAAGGSGSQPRQLASPERPSFESMDLDALGFTESLD